MEKIEKWEIKHKPDVERDEIREIYTNYGFDKETVETLTKKVTSNNELWLKVMMRDELGYCLPGGWYSASLAVYFPSTADTGSFDVCICFGFCNGNDWFFPMVFK